MNSATATIQNASINNKASEIITCVSDAVKDVANNLPELTVNQTTAIKSGAAVLCCGGLVLAVRMITSAKYSLKVSKNDGVTFAPSDNKAA